MKYDTNWDVIVVGAGPAGIKAGEELAKRGLKTLVIDRKQEIGAPKRCGEGLSDRWIAISGLEVDPTWARQRINGAILISPKGKQVWIDTEKIGKGGGYIIERKMWEKFLAANAIRAGAKFMLKANVHDVIKEDEYVKGIKVNYMGDELELRSKIVVAADGVDSRIGRMAGLNTTLPLVEMDSGFQYEMAGVKLLDPNKMELYFGSEIAPRGYIWVFPKGKDVANVGVGINGAHDKTARYYLDKWIEENEERFKDASVIEINAGGIPVTSPVEEFVGNGIMLTGDAARMVNPIHGGGMGTALEAAGMLADVAKDAISSGDVSKEKLQRYQDIWMEKHGDEFRKILKVRHFFEKLNDDQLEAIADMVLKGGLTPDVLVDLGHGKGLTQIIKALIKASPSAAKFLMGFLKG